jgi:hypothetical protein
MGIFLWELLELQSEDTDIGVNPSGEGLNILPVCQHQGAPRYEKKM